MSLKQLRIFVDMDDTLCDFQGAHQKAIEENPKIQYSQSILICSIPLN